MQVEIYRFSYKTIKTINAKTQSQRQAEGASIINMAFESVAMAA